jgi:hypothetical protein
MNDRMLESLRDASTPPADPGFAGRVVAEGRERRRVADHRRRRRRIWSALAAVLALGGAGAAESWHVRQEQRHQAAEAALREEQARLDELSNRMASLRQEVEDRDQPLYLGTVDGIDVVFDRDKLGQMGRATPVRYVP